MVDLYNPLVVEVLEAAAGETPARARRTGRIVTAGVRAHLAAADFVLCASERQRDLWVGAMALHGLLDPALYRADPTLRGLIDVVPFGIPDGPPPAASREGRWPAVGRGDRVLLWGGGIWRWLDALTPIRAMERIRRERDDVHLVFLGTGRPLEARGASVAAEAATEARRLGLLGERVHVEDGWVPYAERGPLLAAADIGVSAHHDHLESRYAFRTRLTDYMWAGLPVVTSSGDALGELVARRGLGAAVAPGDVEGFAAACLALLADEGRYERAAAASAAAGRELRWSEVTRPLQRFCLDPERRRAPVRGSLARESLGQQAWIAVDLLARLGSREVGRRARWAAGRTVRRLA
ncbi:MAG: glycosyltransferase, partial [Thermoleophilaceae bacterium]